MPNPENIINNPNRNIITADNQPSPEAKKEGWKKRRLLQQEMEEARERVYFVCFRKDLKISGFIWVLPVSIICWFIMGIAELFNEIEGVYTQKDGIIVWDLKNNGILYNKVFINRKFWGFSFGCNVIAVDVDRERFGRTVKHEAKHCYQQYAFGVFYYPIYTMIYLFIYLFKKNIHPYYDHPFEISARKFAGQKIKISRDEWVQGPVDRNIFW